MHYLNMRCLNSITHVLNILAYFPFLLGETYHMVGSICGYNLLRNSLNTGFHKLFAVFVFAVSELKPRS